MNKKKIIALVHNDIKKHQNGEMDKMPTINQYAKLSEVTSNEMLKLLLGLTESEQAYFYSHEDNNKD